MERSLAKETPSLVGKTIKLQGWVENLRILSKVSFLDLRDRSGKVQCVAGFKLEDITIESVVEIEGEVKKRPENMVKAGSETGTVEIEVKSYKVLNKAAALPIPVSGDGYDINEEARLKYRYLDLRRDRVHKNIKKRSEYINHIRTFFLGNEFVEIETPMLSKATMEGARDFLVPSRMQKGKFYALPQSPQQYKQLLMTAGFERYFQLARCIRDENLRADRGFEFAQIDLEMSFVNREDVMKIVEESVKKAVKNSGGKLKDETFPVVDYKDAMEKYGADKFDLRTEEDKAEGKLAFAWVINFPMFKKVDKEDAAEVRDGKSGWTFTHNPFSMPIEEHLEWHLKGEHTEEIITTQYDLVCNGLEVAGGSIRAHRSDILKATYKTMGYSEEETQKSVGHMLEAFDAGTPPHGGIAYGVDRMVALLCGEASIKECFAFPMTHTGNISVMDAPNEISEEQLKELGLKLDL
ncbi:MAG: amino acid--tRNA ligase-related protein [Candidatus Dojkabacteria bacterium]